jgi:hypothetical protein
MNVNSQVSPNSITAALCHGSQETVHNLNVVVETFPQTLFLSLPDTTFVEQNLDLSLLAAFKCPHEETCYRLHGLIVCTSSGKFECAVGNTFHHEYVGLRCLAVYNLQPQLTACCIENHLFSFDVTDLPPLTLCTESLNHTRLSTVSVTFDKIQLCNEHWDLILQNKWFTGDVVDSYMILLRDNCGHKALVNNCAWFGNFMFANQNPQELQPNFLCTRKNKHPWFSATGTPNYDFVVMPWSIHNKHFVACVVDFAQKVIVICDSQGGSHPTSVQQCFRFLCQQHFASTGRQIECVEWTHCSYSKLDKDFPLQTDSHNCGPYVCMMVKCMLLKRKLRFKNVKDLRETNCSELTSNKLFF